MKLWKIVLIALTASVCSCVVQKKPQLQITNVLAVTHEGDTLKLPIDVIRPVNYRIINYSSGYGWNNWYRPYYHNYIPSYSSGSTRGSNNSNSNTNSSKNTNGKTPSVKSVPASDNNSANIRGPRK